MNHKPFVMFQGVVEGYPVFKNYLTDEAVRFPDQDVLYVGFNGRVWQLCRVTDDNPQTGQRLTVGYNLVNSPAAEIIIPIEPGVVFDLLDEIPLHLQDEIQDDPTVYWHQQWLLGNRQPGYWLLKTVNVIGSMMANLTTGWRDLMDRVKKP